MALCTICSMDPCPHLLLRGGTAGAPLVAVGLAAKYAPSAKPHCPSCDRVHRNIGTDNQPVCAWRTYSKAKGVDFEAFTPDAVDEFARWFRSGAWAAPVRRSGRAAKPASSAPGAAPGVTPVGAVRPEPAPAPTLPVIDEPSPKTDEELLAVIAEVEAHVDAVIEKAKEPPAPRKAPAFATARDS